MSDTVKVRHFKRRGSKKEEIVSRKIIMETDTRFRIQFPVENDEAYAPEILAIAGASFQQKIPFNPKGDIPEDQVTFLNVYTVPKSEENLQRIARFGKSHRFDFDSDLSIRAWASSSEGKILRRMSFAKSSPTFKIPKIGSIDKSTGKMLKLLPFQPAGVEYLVRTKRAFLADEMGLGKTVQAIAGMAVVNEWPWLVVVPASLKINWYKEIKKWLKPRRVQGKALKVTMLAHHHLTKNSKGGISRDTKKFLSEQQIVIVNYDRLEKYLEFLKTVPWKGFIFDESHYMKAYTSKRSRVAHELTEHTQPEYIWSLSGTPLMNRPLDLISQLRIMNRLGDFGGYNNYIRRYCQLSTFDVSAVAKINAAAKAKMAAAEAGEELMDTSDPLVQQGIEDAMVRKLYENLTDLNDRLRSSCYVRREKSEVLKDLPAKTRAQVPLEITNRKLYERIQADVASFLSDAAVKEEKFIAKLKKMTPAQQTEAIADRRASRHYQVSRAEALVKLQTLKLTAAVGKLEAAKEWITNFLESGQKLVVFAHHKKIIDELIDAFPDAVHTKGGLESRNAAVEAFQNDDNVRLFIGSLKRDGVGITLTASHATAFLELGWTPAAHDQAEDRVHRIGQTDAVTAYYLLANKTVEESIAKLIENKRRLVNAVADGDPLHNVQQGSIVGSLLVQLSGNKAAKAIVSKVKIKSKKPVA